MLASTVIHTDDTPVPVLDRERRATREGRLWVYVGDGRPADIVYDYTATRSRAGPVAFLGDFHGYLQADAYAGYDAVYATGRVVEVGCWAHARRYFFDAKASDPARALPALGFIQQLYAVEREARPPPPTTRRALRRERARPVLDALPALAGCAGRRRAAQEPDRRGRAATRGRSGRRSRAMSRTARSPSTTTSRERALRRSSRSAGTTGRSVAAMPGGRRAAILYSLVATCKAHGSIPGPICATCSRASPRIPIVAAPNCSRGSGQPRRPATASSSAPRQLASPR